MGTSQNSMKPSRINYMILIEQKSMTKQFSMPLKMNCEKPRVPHLPNINSMPTRSSKGFFDFLKKVRKTGDGNPKCNVRMDDCGENFLRFYEAYGSLSNTRRAVLLHSGYATTCAKA